MKKINIITFAALAVFLVVSCKNNLVSKTEQKAPVPVEWIDVRPGGSTISLVKLTTKRLQAKALPENATDKTLIYSSEPGDIASIDPSGLITAKEVGKASITIKAKNGVSTTINVTVTAEEVPVEDIEVPSDLPASLTIGDVYKLTAKAKPDTATEKGLTYTASNDNVQIAEDGTVTAVKDGTVTITVTSKSTPAVTKTVTFTVKKKPQIKYESKQAVMSESAAGTYTFEVQTIDGKLDYEPCFTSNTLPWVSGAPAISSRIDPAKDVISFTCLKNKTVWDRRAYIKFKDKKTGQYVKGADGKTDLTVNIIQKKNENPVVHYKWVYGIEGPKDSEKEKVAIINNSTPTGEFYQQSYVFKWRESETTKFYNVRKLDKLFVQGKYPGNYYLFTGVNGEQKSGKDISQCWAKTASNMLHWWFEHNKENIEYYKTKADISPEKRALYNPEYNRHNYPKTDEDDDRLEFDKKENMKSSIANIFRGYTHNSSNGGLIEDGLVWYFYKRDSLNHLNPQKNLYPSLFNDVFTHETSPIHIDRCETKQEFETIVNTALDSKRAIGVFWQGFKGNKQYKHAVTCWGAAYDEDNNIICLYIGDSNEKIPALYPFGIQYKNDIYGPQLGQYGNIIPNQAYMFNYGLSKKENIYIDGFTTLDLGEAQWQEWRRKHP